MLAVSGILLLVFMSGRFIKYLAEAAAAELAIQAAEDILKTQLKKTDLNKLVDADIKSVGERLN